MSIAVIALDGPSGTGKSTVARRLARQLRFGYLDTGAMYRAATFAALRSGVALDDSAGLTETVAAADIAISTDPVAPGIALDGTPVDTEIRSAEVTAAVSAVSAVPAVRERLVELQRSIIGAAAAGIVVEGRDIGTVVWPAARPKVYLTARPEVRARRRAGELAGAEVAAVAADIARRDRADSTRAASPLARAADAVELDTSELDIDAVVQRLVELTAVPADD